VGRRGDKRLSGWGIQHKNGRNLKGKAWREEPFGLRTASRNIWKKFYKGKPIGKRKKAFN